MLLKKILHLFILICFCSGMFAGSLTGMTIGEERDIGEKLLYKIRSEFTLVDDPDISQYINELGQKVLAEVGQHYFEYHFFVVPSDQFNAFAAPSGLIFFYTGLIETMKTEDELLSVMAHEIAHVESRHIASRSGKSAKVGAITMALAMASLALGDPSLAAGLFTGFQAAGRAVNLHFSRIDEEQSDRLSYEWLHAMRRDPRAMEGMLRTMRRITRYRSDLIPPYLLTHPNPEARLEYVQSLLDYQLGKVEAGYYTKVDNFGFLRMKHKIMAMGTKPEKARSYFLNILGSDKGQEEKMMATYGLAILQAKELNFSEAMDNLAKVQSFFPDQSILDVDKGIMFLDSGDAARALELFSLAAKKDQDDMYAAFHLARAHAKIGNADKAEILYRKIIKAMPEYPQPYFELARIKSNQGNSGLSNFYLASYHLFSGKVDSAREHFVKVKNDKTLSDAIRKEAEQKLQRLAKLKKL